MRAVSVTFGVALATSLVVPFAFTLMPNVQGEPYVCYYPGSISAADSTIFLVGFVLFFALLILSAHVGFRERRASFSKTLGGAIMILAWVSLLTYSYFGIAIPIKQTIRKEASCRFDSLPPAAVPSISS
jgi:hypothetical protein